MNSLACEISDKTEYRGKLLLRSGFGHELGRVHQCNFVPTSVLVVDGVMALTAENIESSSRLEGAAHDAGHSSSLFGPGVITGRPIVVVDSGFGGGGAPCSGIQLQCDICDFKFPATMMINIASKEYPKYRDKPCVAAAKFYDRAIEASGVVPGEIKKNKKRYKNNVMIMRVAHKDDPEEVKKACVCLHKSDRREHAHEIFEIELVEKASIVDETVMYCNENQFVGYLVMYEAMEKLDAKAKWLECVKPDSGVPRRTNKKQQTCLAVELAMRVSRQESNRKQRGIKRTEAPDSDNEEEAIEQAKTRMKTTESPRNVTDSLGLQDPFAAAVLADVRVDATPKPRKPSATDGAQGDGASSVGKKSSSKQSTTNSGGDGGMEDDSDDDDTSCNTLVDARASARKKLKEIRSKLKVNKTSNYERLKAIGVKVGMGNQDVVDSNVEALLKTHETTLEGLEEFVKVCSQLDDARFADKYKEFMAMVRKFRESDVAFSKVLAKVKTIRNTSVKHQTNHARQTAVAVRSVLKANPVKKQGMPKTIVSWAGEFALGIKVGATEP